MQLKPIRQSFQVKYKYQLYFTSGVFTFSNKQFVDCIAAYKPNEPVKLLFVIDDGVLTYHPRLSNQIVDYCKSHSKNLCHTETLVVPGGENVKNTQRHVDLVLKAVNTNKICRHSFIVVVGGGAVIDMVGYAAAIAHRGVRLLRIPTTVLSQNDAAVGVKNSVNSFGKKNFLGTFAPPYAIINDSAFLETLGQRDWISGIAEAIKVALIKDSTFFEFIEDNAIALKDRALKPMQYLIYRCAEMHMQHIARGGDPFESGSSRPLDFGHWAAHKLEFMSNYTLRHGEAVAKGIALDLTYAQLLGLISEKALGRILAVMNAIGFNLTIPVSSTEEVTALLNGIEEFREHLGGELTITLITSIGVKYDVHSIDKEVMQQAIEKLNSKATVNN